MLKRDFKVGDRVSGLVGDDNNIYSFKYPLTKNDEAIFKGTVSRVEDDKLFILVDKDDIFIDSFELECHEWDTPALLTEEEAEEILPKLEQEYLSVQDELKSKVLAAAKAIDEANKISLKFNRELSETDFAHLLYKAMDNAGWSMSSTRCPN